MTRLGEHGVSGSDHGMWRGGRTVSPYGYVQVLSPGHPRATTASHYVFEHILVVEKALGHYLPALAVVHHVDEVRDNNANSNLVACQDRAYHNLLHRRLRALRACGNASAIRCSRCKSYDNQTDISVCHLRNGETTGTHRACNSAHVRRCKARQRQTSQGAN